MSVDFNSVQYKSIAKCTFLFNWTNLFDEKAGYNENAVNLIGLHWLSICRAYFCHVFILHFSDNFSISIFRDTSWYLVDVRQFVAVSFVIFRPSRENPFPLFLYVFQVFIGSFLPVYIVHYFVFHQKFTILPISFFKYQYSDYRDLQRLSIWNKCLKQCINYARRKLVSRKHTLLNHVMASYQIIHS